MPSGTSINVLGFIADHFNFSGIRSRTHIAKEITRNAVAYVEREREQIRREMYEEAKIDLREEIRHDVVRELTQGIQRREDQAARRATECSHCDFRLKYCPECGHHMKH